MASARLVPALMLAAATACAVPAASAADDAHVTANMGPMHGDGVITDRDGNAIGRWSVHAVLASGQFAGTGTITIGSASFSGPLAKGGSYLENGHCYFKFENGRSHADIGGECSTTSIAGHANGFTPLGEVHSFTATTTGTLRFSGRSGAVAGRAATENITASAASGTASIPRGKLTCTRIERIGGNVAGDLPTYEWHPSAMVTLTLGTDYSYRTGNRTGGKFVRVGDRVRFTTGFYAGVVGTLQPDNSGQPAVYFNREDNYRLDGSFRIDSGRTSCVSPRQVSSNGSHRQSGAGLPVDARGLKGHQLYSIRPACSLRRTRPGGLV